MAQVAHQNDQVAHQNDQVAHQMGGVAHQMGGGGTLNCFNIKRDFNKYLTTYSTKSYFKGKFFVF